MTSIDRFRQLLREQMVAVEKEIQSHNRQLEELNRRLEGLNHAAELFETEEVAVAELLRAGLGNGVAIPSRTAEPAAKIQRFAARPPANTRHKRAEHNTQVGRNKITSGPNIRAGGKDGGLTRADMIAAVLRRHPRRSVRELIALLDKEYRWKTTESAVTGHLYARRDKFVRTPPDRSTKGLVSWSSK